MSHAHHHGMSDLRPFPLPCPSHCPHRTNGWILWMDHLINSIIGHMRSPPAAICELAQTFQNSITLALCPRGKINPTTTSWALNHRPLFKESQDSVTFFFFPPKIKMCLQYNLLSKTEAFYLSLLQNRDYMETFNLESI